MKTHDHHISEVRVYLRRCRGAFVGVGAFSAIINVLMLTGSLFMLEVYDRVLPSRSIPTLLGLLALTVLLFTFQGVLEVIRGRILVRIGQFIDRELSPRVFQALSQPGAPATVDGLQPARDVDSIRSFMAGAGPTALFDLPWMPLYLGICFAFHPLIGVTALTGALILVALTVISENLSRRLIQDVAALTSTRNRLAEFCKRNAETIAAMGMAAPLLARWEAVGSKQRTAHGGAADLSGGLGTIGRIIRTMLQSVVLAVGAYLVINQEATAGVIVASSILSGRALAPIDLALANWKGFLGARQSRTRLDALLSRLPPEPQLLELPAPHSSLAVEALAVVPPGLNRPTAANINFRLSAGAGLGVTGPSGSGKSSLARALVGVWQPAHGKVQLDGAPLHQWNRSTLGRHIGYLPQDIELIDGTIAENIARLDPQAADDDIITAAKVAGVHDMITGLPSGYATIVGERGAHLSAGQRQRVALARALFGNPFLVVLDEPNSNLDSDGEAALTDAILGIRARGGIAVVIAHRPSALAGVDHVLTIASGVQQSFGPKVEQLNPVMREPIPVDPGRFRIPSPALAPA
jgi:ATP-binding cassette subfamily C protein